MNTSSITSPSWLLACLAALVGLLLLSTIVLFLQLMQVKTRWKDLLAGSRGEDLERLLYQHLKDRLELQEQVRLLTQRTGELESKMLRTKRFVGVVRYDAFEDVGGSQSFALAVYDDQGNGAVVTSLVGRSDCRVYCKPLIEGKSDRSLTAEEQRAIHEATMGPKAASGAK